MSNLRPAFEVPRRTCSLFGAIKAASTIKNTAILVHGPQGCVYHINYILGLRGDRHAPVYCTCMDEHDVVFGAEERLKEAIEDLDATARPDILVVLSCCASGIIGEDVRNACRSVQTDARVISIEAGGFSGDFTSGYAKTLHEIVAAIAEPVHTTAPGQVNLIGLLRAGPDLREIRRLLSLIGLTTGTVLPAGATCFQIRSIGSAVLNIVMCETSGTQTAEYLQQRFNTPYINTVFPVGTFLSRTFLKDISSALDIRPDPHLTLPSEDVLPPSSPPAIALFSGPTRAIALGRFLRQQGMAPRLIILDFETPLLSKVRAAAGPDCLVLIRPSQDTIKAALQEARITLLIGGLMERPLATALNIPLIDVMHGAQRTTGPDGGNMLLRMISNYGSR